MATVTTEPTEPVEKRERRTPPAKRGGAVERPSWLATAILLIGALYCLTPIAWVVAASTKNDTELFSTFTFAPSTHFWDNFTELSEFRDGLFWQWMLNTVLYAGVAALASTLVSAMAGFALAKYVFPGKSMVFNVLLAGVLVPGIVLAIPQYLLLAEVGMTNTYWSVLLPSILNPYGIYLARIYTAAAVPDDVIEAARTDGANDVRIFARIAVPMMVPGLVTIFLFQFVATWNNFMLPYIMLGDDRLYPLTVGLNSLLNRGASEPALYTIAVMGALLSIIPLIVLFLTLQRYWRVDLAAGATKT